MENRKHITKEDLIIIRDRMKNAPIPKPDMSMILGFKCDCGSYECNISHTSIVCLDCGKNRTKIFIENGSKVF